MRSDIGGPLVTQRRTDWATKFRLAQIPRGKERQVAVPPPWWEWLLDLSLGGDGIPPERWHNKPHCPVCAAKDRKRTKLTYLGLAVVIAVLCLLALWLL